MNSKNRNVTVNKVSSKNTNNFKKIMFTKENIQNKIEEMGELITKDYKNIDEIICIGVLKGSIVFFSDLIRCINKKITIDFFAAESYNDSTSSSGELKIIKDIDIDISGKHILLIDDIIDSGLTLKILKNKLLKKKPESLKICVFLNKPERRTENIESDYYGFVIPDKFVVGYGMDYCQLYRNLPDIVVLK